VLYRSRQEEEAQAAFVLVTSVVLY